MGLFTRYLQSYSKGINLITNSCQLVNFLEDSFIKSILPDFKTTKVFEDKAFLLRFLDSGTKSFKLTEERCDVEGIFNKDFSGPNLTYLVRYLLQKQYLNNDLFLLHGAAVTKADKTALILGSSGSGKTTLSLELCLNRGFEFIGDETILFNLKNGGVSAGNDYIRVDTDNLTVCQALGLEGSGEGKKILSVEELRIKKRVLPSQVDVIMYPKVLPDLKQVKLLGEEESILNMFYEVSDPVRAPGYALVNFGKALPSLDSPKMSSKRLKMVKELIGRGVPSYAIKSSFTFISGFLEDLIDEV